MSPGTGHVSDCYGAGSVAYGETVAGLGSKMDHRDFYLLHAGRSRRFVTRGGSDAVA